MSLFLLNNNNIKKYILEQISGSVAAYSLRKLSKNYNGPCIRVRKSANNTEQDIGFSGNNLDVTSLLSFVGSSNGFITKWYDQSRKRNHALQTTQANQPQIISNGAINIINNIPTISFNSASSQFLNLTNNTMFNNAPGISIFVVCSIASTSSIKEIFFAKTGSSFAKTELVINGANFQCGGRTLDNDTYSSLTGTTNISANTLKTFAAIFNTPSANLTTFINGNVEKSGAYHNAGNYPNINSAGIYIGNQLNAQYFNGNISELIIFNSVIPNCVFLQTNQKAYYGVV